MPKVSKRGITAPNSPIRKLTPFANKAKADGKQIYHLNIGQPDIPSPSAAIDAVKNDQTEVIAYGPAQGNLTLRKKYAQYYNTFGANLQEGDIFVTSGASEAIVFAISACCDPGDEVLIPEPFYANYIGFANFCSTNVVPVSSYLETAFDLPDIQKFRAKITDKTKAILLCNPGNPTGKVYSKEDLEAIIELTLEKDIFLIIDEVYKEFCYDREFCSALQFEQVKEQVIVIDSISKIFSLCGARIGFLMTKNNSLQATIMKFAQMRLCPSYYGQLLAEASFENRAAYIAEIKEEYRKRRDTLYQELQKIEDISIYLPEGAFYIIAGLPVDDAEAFCTWMLSDFSYHNKTVMLSPAAGFYANTELGKQQIRIAFILNSEDICKAMECLRVGIKAYNTVRV